MPSLRAAALAGLLAGLALAVAEALLRLLGVPLPAELIADRVLPHLAVGDFLHLLSLMGGAVAAKSQAFLGGFAGAVAAGVLVGCAYGLLLRHPAVSRHPLRTLLLAVVLGWIAIAGLLWPVLGASYAGFDPALAVAINAAALLLQFAIFAGVLYMALRPGKAPERADEPRRRLLLGTAGIVLAVSTGGLVALLDRVSALAYDGTGAPGPVAPITPVDEFYVVTKNLIDPAVYTPVWRLEVGGRVAHPAVYTLDDLEKMPGCVTQETTLECISNGVGRTLISNAAWHGIPLRTLIEAASPQSSAGGVNFRGVDGYLHSASLATAVGPGTFLAWMMNGQPLPDRHGHPLRLLVPSAYGEVSVKWLTSIEVVDQTEPGYYETQGWQPRFVHTMSRIDRPGGGQVVPLGVQVELQGIAYAADRGISQVEVSSDGGSTWSPARITYGKPMTWSVWTAAWTPDRPGPATLTVRARDGRGDLQTSTPHGFAPAGATGLHRVRVMVAG